MSIFSKIGSAIGFIPRKVGHALNSTGIPLVSNAGGALEHAGNAVSGKGSFFQELGRAAQDGAPIAALVPGVGPLAAGAIGAGGNLLEHGKRTKLFDAAKAGAIPALEAELLGGEGYKGIGGVLPKLKGAASTANKFLSKSSILGNSAGKLDLSKILALGGATSNIVGNAQQRGSSERYNNATIDQRNQLMSKILAGL